MAWGAFIGGFIGKYSASPTLAWHALSSYDPETIYDWKLAQYLINYQHMGFVKRGLIPSLLAPIPQPYWLGATLVFNAAALSAVALSAAFFLARARRILPAREHLVLSALILLSPLTIANAGIDFGRFDIAELAILIASLAAIRTGRHWVVLPLTCGALLIHSAYLFYGLPCIALAWTDSYRSTGNRRIHAAAVTLIATLTTITCLALFGRYTAGADALMQAMAPYHISRDAITVWTRPGSANLGLVWAAWAAGEYNAFDLAAYALLITAGISMVFVATRDRSLIRYAPLFVLGLFLVGTDYARWTSMFIDICLIVTAVRILDGAKFQLIRAPRAWASLALLLAIPLGPIGTGHAFPLFQHLVQ
ncbi:hypothetical protein C27AD_15704 [Salinisphaera hydrothermalis C27AD]